MEFGSDPALEARVGRICLVFARVEQEAGQVVQAARGRWDTADATDHLDVSASSPRLTSWLEGVAGAYPEVEVSTRDLISGIGQLKDERDVWAHSAATTNLFLLLRETGKPHLDLTHDIGPTMLNSRRGGHLLGPTDPDVADFTARSSILGAAAQALARTLAQLTSDEGVRPVRAAKR